MVSHEYGTKKLRPHHHAIIFGYNPKNQIFNRTTPKGEKLFTSTEIEKLWKNGFHSIGTANEKTAYYIASYSLKGKKHTFIDPDTGETNEVSDSMDCSKRPAIGYTFFEENYQQMLDSEQILPRYYLKCFLDPKKSVFNPETLEKYENDRILKFKNRSDHEKYAKYIIDRQKTKINSTFRERDATLEKEDLFFESDLLNKRDDYVNQARGNL